MVSTLNSQIYQNIGSDGTEIVNIVELQPLLAPILPSTVARLVVGAEGSVASPERLDLAFKSSAFTPLTFLGRKVSRGSK
jgi:PAP_fibrillin